MIDLKQLILIAPFPEEVKAEINSKADSLSEIQRKDLENLAWNALIESYLSKISFETQTAFMEAGQGLKKPEEIDPDKIEENILNELLIKLEGVATADQIQEVRERLQEQTPTPPKTS